MSPTHHPVAVVTGGSAGVGRATVDALLDRGYRVAVLARGQERLDEMAAELGDRIWTEAVDVSDGTMLDQAANRIVAELGVPEIWVNSAMLTSFSPFDKVGETEFRKITETTYLGTVNGCRAALRIMSRGNIVNVGSGLAYVSVPNQAAYCGAKHAVEGFTQSLRIEIRQAGRPITLSMVQLPAVNTPQFDWTRNRMDRKPQPAPPIFQPEVAARGILRAIDTDAREMLVGSSVLKLMVGNILAPDVVESRLEDQGVRMQKSDRPTEDGPDNLDGPVRDQAATAHGPYDSRAYDDGLIVDGDLMRKVLVFGGAAAILGLGILVGRSTKPANGSSPQQDRNETSALPFYHRPTEYRS